MTGLEAAVPTIAMLAAFALVAFGVRLLWLGRERLKGGLMLAAAVVLVGNVVVWTW